MERPKPTKKKEKSTFSNPVFGAMSNVPSDHEQSISSIKSKRLRNQLSFQVEKQGKNNMYEKESYRQWLKNRKVRDGSEKKKRDFDKPPHTITIQEKRPRTLEENENVQKQTDETGVSTSKTLINGLSMISNYMSSDSEVDDDDDINFDVESVPSENENQVKSIKTFYSEHSTVESPASSVEKENEKQNQMIDLNQIRSEMRGLDEIVKTDRPSSSSSSSTSLTITIQSPSGGRVTPSQMLNDFEEETYELKMFSPRSPDKKDDNKQVEATITSTPTTTSAIVKSKDSNPPATLSPSPSVVIEPNVPSAISTAPRVISSVPQVVMADVPPPPLSTIRAVPSSTGPRTSAHHPEGKLRMLFPPEHSRHIGSSPGSSSVPPPLVPSSSLTPVIPLTSARMQQHAADGGLPMLSLEISNDEDSVIEIDFPTLESRSTLTFDRYFKRHAEIALGDKTPAFDTEEQWEDFLEIYKHLDLRTPYEIELDEDANNISKKKYSDIGHRLIKDGCKPAYLLDQIPTFRPTEEQFSDFNRYNIYLQWVGGLDSGGCRIIPPKSWTKTFILYDRIKNNTVDLYYQKCSVPPADALSTELGFLMEPLHSKQEHVKKTTTSYRKKGRKPVHANSYSTTVGQFFSFVMKSSSKSVHSTMDMDFIRSLQNRDIQYCKDSLGSYFPPNFQPWNLNYLDTPFYRLGEWGGSQGGGLMRSYKYIGMPDASFADHIEDWSSPSINYLHGGATKKWRMVPSNFGWKLKSAIDHHIYQNYPHIYADKCTFKALHKMFLNSDEFLTANQIQYNYIDQIAGSFIITAPFSFHSGFSLDFNIAEAVNFNSATNWINLMANHPVCKPTCKFGQYTSKKQIDFFTKSFNSQMLSEWKNNTYPRSHPFELKGSAYPTETIGETSPFLPVNYHCLPTDESIHQTMNLHKFYLNEDEIPLISDPTYNRIDNRTTYQYDYRN